MKKIIIVTPYFYPSLGGVETYVFNIASGLKGSYGWTVMVITSNTSGKSFKEEIINGIKIYRLPYWCKLSNTPINFGWIIDIWKILKKEKPNVVNGHSPVPFLADIAAFICYCLQIPFVLTYHSGKMAKSKTFIDIPIKIYEKYFFTFVKNYAKKIIVTSDYIKKEIFKSYKKKIYVIPPGIDLKLFHPVEMDKKENIILFVGRIEKTSEWKGLHILIDSLKVLQNRNINFKLICVGSGDAIDEYRQYSEKNNVTNKISFLGPLYGKDLTNIYNKSTLLVLPSLSKAESFGIVLIEAMACKLPVIGSNIGGIPDVIEHEVNGLLVKPNDPEKLASALTKILTQRKIAKELGEKGYRKVLDNYTWDKQIARTNTLFQSL